MTATSAWRSRTGGPWRPPALALAAFATLALCAGGAHAEAPQATAQAAIRSLLAAGAALPHADRPAAAQQLAAMNSDVERLRIALAALLDEARASQAVCEARSVDVTGRIDQAFQAREQLQAEARDLDAQRAQQERRRDELNMALNQLRPILQLFEQDQEKREACRRTLDDYFANFSFCFGAVADTVFTRGDYDRRLGHAIEELYARGRALADDAKATEARRQHLAARQAEAEAGAERLQALRERLEVRDKELRAATVDLTALVQFWSQSRTQAEFQVADPVEGLHRVNAWLDRHPDQGLERLAGGSDLRTLRETLARLADQLGDPARFRVSADRCREEIAL